MVLIAHTFGCTPHLSPLLRKAKGLGLGDPRAMLRVAVARGCHHYAETAAPELPEVEDPGSEVLSDEELGIAMISAAQEHDPRLIRCAAQLLGAPGISAVRLARLARMERCAPLLAYIARHAQRWHESRRDFWTDLLERLPRGGPSASELWPHPSRFMIQSGYQRGGGVPAPIWLSPRAERAKA